MSGRIVRLDGVPSDLTSLKRWVVWQYETREGKTTKVPYCAFEDAGRASSTDPATWTDFDSAVRFHEENDWTDGVGFVVTDDDDIVGVDLDHCRDRTSGDIAPWAAAIVDALNSYTEITPSQEGLRVFVRGTLPPSGRKKNDIEMYSKARYLTVTGRHLRGTPRTIRARPKELLEVHLATFGAKPQDDEAPTERAVPRPVNLADADLLVKARLAANGAGFSRLWAGDWRTDYGSQSEADLALANHLSFWTGGDASRMDGLFRSSGLFRPKWDERHFSDGRTYGQATIDTALAGAREFYTPPAPAPRLKLSGGLPREDRAEEIEPPVGGFALTDMGNAQRLVARFGHGIRFCHLWNKWLIWDGRRWKVDDSGVVMRCAKDTARGIFTETLEMDEAEERKALGKFALRSQADARLRAMVALAESEPGIPVTPDQLDADPWLLCVQNGVLDLRTGLLAAHRREHLITKLAAIVYDPTAACPLWSAFFARIMDGKTELMTFLQRAVGYALTGVTGERALFILHGVGANGKSTFLETIREALGDYAMRTPTETLLARHEGAIPNDVARLKGARFVSASEAEEGKRLAESLVKSLTGGDTISARFMRGEWFDFKPEFKLWLATNHKPVIRGTDKGIWDRIRLVPFNVRIPEDEQDKALTIKLRDELAGVLAWAVEGCLAWQRDGLGAPAEVRAATDSYRVEMDVLGGFLAEKCLFRDGARATARALYDAYKAWCDGSGERAMTQRAFGMRLTERGLERRRSGTTGAYEWYGITLLSLVTEAFTEGSESSEPFSIIGYKEKLPINAYGEIKESGSDSSDSSVDPSDAPAECESCGRSVDGAGLICGDCREAMPG